MAAQDFGAIIRSPKLLRSLRRKLMHPRTGLREFTRLFFHYRKGFVFLLNRHHERLWDGLSAVYRGECKRLIINMPPRYGKTEVAVVCFIAWCLAMAPDSEWIHTSYSGPLALSNSVAVRDIVKSDLYRALFPEVQVRADFSSRGDWRTTAGGVVYATGSDGSVTGFGAGKVRPGFGGAIIVDDPHKADEARSDAIRSGVISNYQNTLQSRTNSPSTPIILIMQRLHEEDLAGWMLAGGSGEEWEHLCLAAIQPDGSALWPSKHSIEELRRMEQAMPYMFGGQYMQSPSPLAGGFFKPDQLRIIDALPAVPITWVRGWDLAATEVSQTSRAPDYTAGARLGTLPDGRFVIGDVVRFQEDPGPRDAAIRNTAAADGQRVLQSLPQDPGQAGKSQVQQLARVLARYPVHFSPESGDKVTRAELFAGQVNVGNVLMLRGAWNKELAEEMRMFPNSKKKDQIDALSRAYSALLDMPIHAPIETHNIPI